MVNRQQRRKLERATGIDLSDISGDALEEALRIIADRYEDGAQPWEPFTVRNETITLKARTVPPHVVYQLEQRFPEPTAPVRAVEQRDGKVLQEENLADPGYRAAIAQWQEDFTVARQRALFTLGLELVAVDGADAPGDDGWVEELEIAGIEVHREGPLRFLDWLQLYALVHTDDLGKATARTLRMVGTLEADVALATESRFPGLAERLEADGGAPGAS